MVNRYAPSPDEGFSRARPSEALTETQRDAIRLRLGLSPREFEIALLVMDGFSRRGIARELSSSRHTVDSHMRRIFRKLGVRSRASVVSRLFTAALTREDVDSVPP